MKRGTQIKVHRVNYCYYKLNWYAVEKHIQHRSRISAGKQTKNVPSLYCYNKQMNTFWKKPLSD